MIVLTDVLGAAEVARLTQGLADAPYRDGRATAGPDARRVKLNQQARGDDPQVAELAASVRRVLEGHPTFQALARPARWSRLMFSRYVPGQRYGLHAVQQRDQRQPLGRACAQKAACSLHTHQSQADDGARCGVGAVDAGQRVVLRVHDAARLAQQETAVCCGFAGGEPAGVEIGLGTGR